MLADRVRMANNTIDGDRWTNIGSRDLIAGTMDSGYFGVVPYNELVSGSALASTVGISQGTIQFSTEGWLKFAYKGKIQFVAKKPFRHSISWNAINAANCVYGNRTVVIQGYTFKIRLLGGTAEVEGNDLMSTDRGAIGSEWNKLIMPIHFRAPSSWLYPQYADPVTEDWGIYFTDTQLGVNQAFDKGSGSWCIGNYAAPYATRRSLRGEYCSSMSNPVSSNNAIESRGWRPVLELVV